MTFNLNDMLHSGQQLMDGAKVGTVVRDYYQENWTLQGDGRTWRKGAWVMSADALAYPVTVVAIPTPRTLLQKGDRVRFTEDYMDKVVKGDTGTVDYPYKPLSEDKQLIEVRLDKGFSIAAFDQRMEKIDNVVDLPQWEKDLLLSTPDVPEHQIGDPVYVQGWSKGFDGPGFVSRIVQRAYDLTYTVEFPDREGDFECGSFPERYVIPRAVVADPVVSDAEVIGGYVATQAALDCLPERTVIVSLRSSTAVAKDGDNWYAIDGREFTQWARFTARNEGFVVIGIGTP